uniref:Uncharacterized protein n=1 Tax=Eutreptiella gymnastica TaxID=73025 RepID=A0A7S1JAY0_9EUGL|mmetsp:Transcript_7947/g.14158  ORF Transcript_7947/g.14158 Transcript_7947/m.14158 type:complete len:292 (+) Transcript_7947:196-1071(+)
MAANSRGKMDYIKEHKIHILFEQLAGTLLADKPAQPIPFLIEQLKAIHNGNLAATKPEPTPAVVAAPEPEKPKDPYKVTLAVFGLDAAGKSTMISAVAGEVDPNLAPTVGFNPNHFQSESWDLMMFDLGGGPKFRNVWKEYYSELHGIIFVVDSADSDRFIEARDALKGILDDSRAAGKPLLIFANKQDKSTAKTAAEMETILEVKDIERHHVFGCSAIADPVDENIEKGLEWVLEEVTTSFDALSERIKMQLAEDKERRRQAMAEQAKRVEQYRKEWADKEGEKGKKEEA